MSGDPLWFLGTVVRMKLTGDATGGRLAVWEATLPRGAAPPVHTHPQDETFYVLDGKLVAWIEDERRECGPGSAVFAPGGTPHAFRVESDTARLLFLSTPAGIEDFVLALAEPAAWPWLPPPPDGPRVPAAQVEAVEREHGIVRLAPPPVDAFSAQPEPRSAETSDRR